MTENAQGKFQQLLIEKPDNKNKISQWDQLSDLQEENMEEIKSQEQRPMHHKREEIKPKLNRQKLKASEIQEYQKALVRLRSECRIFFKPYDKHKLNISIMQAIKMIKDALEKEKDFTKALRNMGCKTGLRVRNKSAARELFQAFLAYLQSGEIPQWLKNSHEKLMQKNDKYFNYQMRVEE